jgi:hypothetical protein
MKSLLLIPSAAIVLTLTLALAAPAAAGTTTVPAKMTFTEPLIPGSIKGCPVAPDGFCGSGEVIPFGQATETIAFNAGCGGSCDLRTINLAAGSIFSDETFSNPGCPGVCQPNRAEPSSGTLTDTIVGGTGLFAGANGTLSDTVRGNGPESQIQLSGTITLTS